MDKSYEDGLRDAAETIAYMIGEIMIKQKKPLDEVLMLLGTGEWKQFIFKEKE